MDGIGWDNDDDNKRGISFFYLFFDSFFSLFFLRGKKRKKKKGRQGRKRTYLRKKHPSRPYVIIVFSDAFFIHFHTIVIVINETVFSCRINCLSVHL